MNLGTTELDASFEKDGALTSEDYTPEIGVWDTIKAAWKNNESMNTMFSATNHFNDTKDKMFDSYKDELSNIEMIALQHRMNPLLDRFEEAYKDGTMDDVIGESDLKEAFIHFKQIEGTNGRGTLQQARDDAKANSIKEYQDSDKILKQSEHWIAKMVGTGASASSNPISMATMFMGGEVAMGGTLAVNAAKAFFTEAALEGVVQAVERPAVSSYKKELGLKTSIADDAYTAISAMATAGLFRATGSAMFDLTPLGKATLKVKDPELAKEYDNLTKNMPTDNVDEHIQNMQKVEFGDGVTEIKNPSKEGEALNKAEPIKEFDESQIVQPKEVPNYDDMQIVSGKDMDGNPEFKSYKALNEELDIEAEHYKRISKCLL